MSYPIQRGSDGYFEQTYDTFSNERIKLISLLNTVEGERLMQPLYGINIHKYLFDKHFDTDVIKEYLINKIHTWIPLVIVESIEILDTNNTNILNIKLTYTVKNNTDVYDILEIQFN